MRRYVDALSDALVVRQLQPHFANVTKRQVRAPKIYVRDSGLLHRLLGIGDGTDLMRHPKVGASWEGMVIEQILTLTEAVDASFWATHGGAELDLLISHNQRTLGFEIKRTDRPTMTRSIHIALADLELDHLYLVHAGEHTFALNPKVTAIPASDLLRREPNEI